MSAQLLVVDDQASILQFLRQTLAHEGHVVHTAANGEEALAAVHEQIPDLVLLDMVLPDRHGLEVLREIHARFPRMCVILMSAHIDLETAVDAMRGGAFDVIRKPFKIDQLHLAIRRGLAATRDAAELAALRRRDQGFARTPGMVLSTAPAMQEIYATVRKIAQGEKTSILIEGESGVGKDVLANLIHASSPRSDKAFLEINCAALPEKLLESELFGHEQGAFTDAGQLKQGLLELAHHGTVFLDEIGEMSVTLQVKLLRVLERQVFRRVGGLKDITVDVRLISATNRDLSAMVRAGTFREDLYYRLKVVPLRMPSLRERPEDILPLADHFLRIYALQFHKRLTGLTPDAVGALLAYPWPGNIRELRNVIERAVLLGEGEALDAVQLNLPDAHLPDAQGVSPVPSQDLSALLGGPLPAAGLRLEETLAAAEERCVRQALVQASGNQTRAAELLGMNRDKLRYRLKMYKISEDVREPADN
ncbi:MAG: sigma-54 dependent transcriptional regulator [Candidatus Latescibacteria bacterium]|nr:sigma-54 dependent transcriptional regulator [Candidatus Latescibacterota bacterium]